METVSLDEEYEEANFGPWLVDNIELLAAAIGIEIEEVECEDDVGGLQSRRPGDRGEYGWGHRNRESVRWDQLQPPKIGSLPYSVTTFEE